MNEQAAYVKNLKGLTRANPTKKHLDRLEDELFTFKSDRACVVVMGSIIDTSLERLIFAKMRDNLNADDRDLSCCRFRGHRDRCFMEPEVGYGATAIYARVQA
jgi:hypothetical protein